jgi:hypothetical protein
MAFAINTYNALVIHALVVHGVKFMESATGRLNFFQKVRVTRPREYLNVLVVAMMAWMKGY